jgi:hypothetical protein
MLIRRRKHLVIEIMKQSDESPLILICLWSTVAVSTSAHGSFDGQRVFSQAFTFCVFAEKFPGVVSAWHNWM